MSSSDYILEKYSGPKSRYICPNCHKKGEFTRYVHEITGECLNLKVGICNRKINCGYHYTPKAFFADWDITCEPRPTSSYQIPKPKKPKPPSFIPDSWLKHSQKAYSKNNFVIFLNNFLGTEVTNKLLEEYRIGTSKHWPGATVFWQIDRNDKIRTGKIMLFDAVTGKRVKKPYKHIKWVHNFIKDTNFKKQQCLFGEHLLMQHPMKPIMVVESEKSAVIASAFFPQYIWLASGGLDQLSLEKCSVLEGREIILLPDLDAYEKWEKKATEFRKTLQISMSDILERIATEAEREEGLDIADFLIAGREHELLLFNRKLIA